MNPAFDGILSRMSETHNSKGHDYAEDGNPYSNFEEAAAFAGVTVDQVFAVMLGIKQARIKQLLKAGKTPNNESLDDSRLDGAVYAALRASYPVWLNQKEHDSEPESEWENTLEAAWSGVSRYQDPCTFCGNVGGQ